jgi:hypothetical protein
MDNLITKFYDGYEGEPEIQFIKGSDKGSRTIVSIWDGYFDDIMNQFRPTASGWNGLAYYYHLALGWAEGVWEIPDLNSALTEFQSINVSSLRFPETAEVLSAICNLLKLAIKENQKIWIDKD